MGYFLLGSNAVNIFGLNQERLNIYIKTYINYVTKGSVQHWGAAAPLPPPLVSSNCLLEVLNEYLHHYYGYLDL